MQIDMIHKKHTCLTNIYACYTLLLSLTWCFYLFTFIDLKDTYWFQSHYIYTGSLINFFLHWIHFFFLDSPFPFSFKTMIKVMNNKGYYLEVTFKVYF